MSIQTPGPVLTLESARKQVRTENWNVQYYEAGEGEPLILLHGSGPGATGWSNFNPNIGPLSTAYRVLAVDMPGWGGSDPTSIEAADHVETLRQFMDELGIDRAALIGNSMGGVTSIRFAAMYPERVSHLITMGSGSVPQPTLFGPGGASEGMKVLFAAYRDPSLENMRQLASIMTFDPAFASEELARQRADAAAQWPQHLENFVSCIPQGGPIRRWPTMEQIASVTAPTLIVHGRNDRVVHFEHSLRLVTAIQNSRLVLLNRCGHWAQLEHANEFNHLVDHFIATNA
ncbi:alpha/beta fold hydrolase [Rhodococcus hoagii]|nr:alpha/beta fold hydrolase [Prescottella equi]